MPNDAKLGLLAGLTVVLLVALLFFRKEGPPAPPGVRAAPASVPSPAPPPSPTPASVTSYPRSE